MHTGQVKLGLQRKLNQNKTAGTEKESHFTPVTNNTHRTQDPISAALIPLTYQI